MRAICAVALCAVFALVLRAEADTHVFTSTRYVTGLALASDGALWASTMGGVLVRSSDGEWRKFTRADGLPSNEANRVMVVDGSITVVCPTGSAIRRDGRWQSGPSPSDANLLPAQTCSCTWRGKTYAATVTRLSVREDGKWRRIELPKSTGSHISAMASHGDSLWAAMFGDGIYAFDGRQWKPVKLGLPSNALEITALAVDGDAIRLGTRHEGIWEFRAAKWHQHLQPNEPLGHNCQSLTTHDGNLYVGTLEGGMLIHSSTGWSRMPGSGSDSPHRIVAARDCLYVRHLSGQVDRMLGKTCEKDIGRTLPRKEVFAIAAEGTRLYAAQWGGWSEYDGHTWTPHLKIPALQGIQTTAICPDGDRVWLGTQGRGLAEVNKATEEVSWQDERNGLPDDWVRCILRTGGTIYAGTFVGGLAWLHGTKWELVPETKGLEITDLLPDGTGGVLIATRKGVLHRLADGSVKPVNPPWGGQFDEAQALTLDQQTLWIGTRTGLYSMPVTF